MMHFYPSHYFWHIIQITLFLFYRDCMKLGEVDGKKIGCTVSLLVCFFLDFYNLLCHSLSLHVSIIHPVPVGLHKLVVFFVNSVSLVLSSRQGK